MISLMFIMIFIFVFICFSVHYFNIKSYDNDNYIGVTSNKLLEFIWSLIPSFILILIAVPTIGLIAYFDDHSWSKSYGHSYAANAKRVIITHNHVFILTNVLEVLLKNMEEFKFTPIVI